MFTCQHITYFSNLMNETERYSLRSKTAETMEKGISSFRTSPFWEWAWGRDGSLHSAVFICKCIENIYCIASQP